MVLIVIIFSLSVSLFLAADLPTTRQMKTPVRIPYIIIKKVELFLPMRDTSKPSKLKGIHQVKKTSRRGDGLRVLGLWICRVAFDVKRTLPLELYWVVWQVMELVVRVEVLLIMAMVELVTK